MSYDGPTRARGTRRPTTAAAAAQPTRGGRKTPSPPAARASETDWERVALFGVGVALGIAVGAGAALLTAPAAGAETRAVLRGRARRLKRSTARRGRDAWQELQDELHNARLALRRRKLQRARRRELEREELAVE